MLRDSLPSREAPAESFDSPGLSFCPKKVERNFVHKLTFVLHIVLGLYYGNKAGSWKGTQ
jgi:hypothetical protein